MAKATTSEQDIEAVAVEVIRSHLVEFIKQAPPRDLAEVARCVDAIESDPAEMRRELMRALQQEAARRR